MILIIDSNVLLDYPQVVEDKNNQLIIATSVLKEQNVRSGVFP